MGESVRGTRLPFFENVIRKRVRERTAQQALSFSYFSMLVV